MTTAFNWRQVLKILGFLLLLEAAFMLTAVGVSLIYAEDDWLTTLFSSIITAAVGVACTTFGTDSRRDIGVREGYLLVGLIWIVFSIFGMLPFMLDHRITTVTDAFFETMAGFTTTGATIIDDVERIPHGLLYWRSLTQWLGGMGIVVLFLAVLPTFGTGMQLFMAEVPGPTHSKILPRITDSARRLWDIYIILTAACALLLWCAGMDLFDAICHALTTLATGGFSTKNASIAYWDSSIIDFIIVFFMLFGGINFSLLYTGVVKRNRRKLFADEELRAYLFTIAAVAIIIAAALIINVHDSASRIALNVKNAIFQAVSVITTTGFSNTDYVHWPPVVVYVLLLVSVFGGMSGSTSGGVKTIRVHIILKNISYELRRIIHPKAIMPMRINHRIVSDGVVSNIYSFIVSIALITLISTGLLTAMGMRSTDALNVSVASIANVGMTFGEIGAAGSYASIPTLAKWLLTLLMIIGRLELYTILLLFTPQFWKK